MSTHTNNKPLSFLQGLCIQAGYEKGFFKKKQLSNYSFLSELDELDIIVISHPKFDAAIALQGAHLLNWQLKGQIPTFWLSPLTHYKKNNAIRGGIPICWPWFGKQSSPAHGFARNSLWQIEDIYDDNERFYLLLTLTQTNETKAIWANDFELKLHLYLSDECELKLESQGNYQFTGALHSYFNLSHINNVQVTGLGTEYIDSLNNNQSIKSSFNSVTFMDHIDRIYTNSQKDIAIKDSGFNRQILITNSHALDSILPNPCDTVVWNPGSQLCKSMPDMPNDGYEFMGCVESAVISNPIALASPSLHKINLVVRQAPL